MHQLPLQPSKPGQLKIQHKIICAFFPHSLKSLIFGHIIKFIKGKEKWKDEYLKWICGFTNAQGGKIYIGKNDKGVVVGIANAKRLMDDLPNKVVTNLGVICDINLLEESEKQIIEIIVEPYPNPVNYKGLYHYRTGSTKQELKGAALDKFLLQRYGKTWDSVPFPRISVNDLDENAFKIFRKKGKNSGRVNDEILNDLLNL